MKKLLAILAVAIAIPTMSFAEGEGRYQGVAPVDPTYQGIWVVDTKLGTVKYCFFDTKVSFCSNWSTQGYNK